MLPYSHVFVLLQNLLSRRSHRRKWWWISLHVDSGIKERPCSRNYGCMHKIYYTFFQCHMFLLSAFWVTWCLSLGEKTLICDHGPKATFDGINGKPFLTCPKSHFQFQILQLCSTVEDFLFWKFGHSRKKDALSEETTKVSQTLEKDFPNHGWTNDYFG